MGDNTLPFTIARLAEEARADAAAAAAAAAGLSVEDDSDDAAPKVPLLVSAARAAAREHSGLFEQLLKPLFAKKAVVPGPHFLFLCVFCLPCVFWAVLRPFFVCGWVG